MTQVLIPAGSNKNIELNQEELQFYRKIKNKQILEVRSALQQLHCFNILHKKDKVHADLAPVWQALLVLSKIIGCHSHFQAIQHLQIPHALLTQGLMTNQQLFCKNCYLNNCTISNDQQKYYILIQGVVERGQLKLSGPRSRQSRCSTLSIESLKPKKANRRKIARTEDQMPVCLNSCGSDYRSGQTADKIQLRTVTHVEMFEVQAARWRRYVQGFKRLEAEYIMSFIRKKLAVNLNIDYVEDSSKQNNSNSTSRSIFNNRQSPQNQTQDARHSRRDSIRDSNRESIRQTLNQCIENPKQTPLPKQNDKQESQALFTLQQLKRKTVIQLSNSCLYLLFLGEIVISSPFYKLQVSRGCILNSAVGQSLSFAVQDESSYCQSQNDSEVEGKVTAEAKTDVLLININIKRLQTFFQTHREDQELLKKMLINLQLSRRAKKEEGDKIADVFKSVSWQQANKPAKQFDYLQLHPKNIKKIKLSKIILNAKDQSKELKIRQEHRERIFQCQQIESRVNKTVRAAELKQQVYLKKAQLSQDNPKPLCLLHKSPNSINQSLSRDRFIQQYSPFKGSVGRIENKTELLRQLVRQNRKRKLAQSMGVVTLQPRNSTGPTQVCASNSASFLKRKLKQIYVKTEQCDNLVNLSIMSERIQQQNSSYLQNTQRSPVALEKITANPIQGQAFKDLNKSSTVFGYGNWVNSRIIKKMASGQIRKVKLR